MTQREGHFTFKVVVLKDGRWSRPPMALLPRRIGKAKVTAGAGLSPTITDDFVLLPLKGKYSKGDSFEVVFEAPVGFRSSAKRALRTASRGGNAF